MNFSELFSSNFERDSVPNAQKAQEQQKGILSVWSSSFAERIYLKLAVLTFQKDLVGSHWRDLLGLVREMAESRQRIHLGYCCLACEDLCRWDTTVTGCIPIKGKMMSAKRV